MKMLFVSLLDACAEVFKNGTVILQPYIIINFYHACLQVAPFTFQHLSAKMPHLLGHVHCHKSLLICAVKVHHLSSTLPRCLIFRQIHCYFKQLIYIPYFRSAA